MQIDEQARILEELNHKIDVKENQLGISKEKEYIAKIKECQKNIDELQKALIEKEAVIQKLYKQMSFQSPKDITKAESDTQTDITIPIILIKELTIDQRDQFEYNGTHLIIQSEPVINDNDRILIENLTKEIDNLTTNKKALEDTNASLNLNKRNYEDKIAKMKKGLEEIQKRFEVELNNKEKKSMEINQKNSRLFEDISNKNKELALELTKSSNHCMLLAKEKYEIENIALKQERRIKELEHSISCSILNSNINNINDSNMNSIGLNSKSDNYSSHKQLLPATHKLIPINAFKKFHLKTSSENSQTLNLDESYH